jgi:hypothetical protein
MQHYKVALSHHQVQLVLVRRGLTFNQVEEPFSAGRNMGTVQTNVKTVGTPITITAETLYGSN